MVKAAGAASQIATLNWRIRAVSAAHRVKSFHKLELVKFIHIDFMKFCDGHLNYLASVLQFAIFLLL